MEFVHLCQLNNYKCEYTCVFYFNINGSVNDTSNIYLFLFANHTTKNKNTFFILKNNEGIDEFPKY